MLETASWGKMNVPAARLPAAQVQRRPAAAGRNDYSGRWEDEILIHISHSSY